MVVGIDVSISSSPALFFRFVFYRRGMDVAISGLSRLSSSQSILPFFFVLFPIVLRTQRSLGGQDSSF